MNFFLAYIENKNILIIPNVVPKNHIIVPLNLPNTKLPAIIVIGSGNGNTMDCRKHTKK